MVKVSCNTSPSIPASTLTWRYLNPMRDAAPLPQPKERRLPGTYGGTITRYTVVVGFVVCVCVNCREKENKQIKKKGSTGAYIINGIMYIPFSLLPVLFSSLVFNFLSQPLPLLLTHLPTTNTTRGMGRPLLCVCHLIEFASLVSIILFLT